jgi:hypothetical protein
LTHVAAAAAATGCILLGTGSAAFAIAPTAFTPGDLVIYETLGTSSAAQAVSLVDYTVSGASATSAGTSAAPSGFAANLPTAVSGNNKIVTDSGAALNDGLLNLSADGTELVAAGYDDPVGSASATGSEVPRTVALVSQTGTVDSSTALTSTGTSSVEGNNFRSADVSVAGGNIYTGSKKGAGVEADGATTPVFLNADSVDDIQTYSGNLYESTGSGIVQLGTGLPTSGTPTETNLVGATNAPTGFGIDEFAFVSLKGGSTPDTLYAADGGNGATSGDPNQIEKYTLEGTSWVLTGSVPVPLATGVAVSVTNGIADVYATGALLSTSANNTVLYGFQDSSGYGGTLTGTATQLATAPTGDDFHGLAFAPGTTLPNNGVTPEVPFAILLPGVALLLLGGVYVIRRRRQTIAA